MNVIDKFFNFELTSKKNEEVLKKSSSLMDIAEYIYNKYYHNPYFYFYF